MDNDLELRVYSSKSSGKKFFSMVQAMFHDLWKSRDLGFRLAWRDTRALYRKSLLGILWAFISPLMTALVWIFLNGVGIVKVGATPIPYPAYVFCGTMFWALFSESIMAPLSQTQQSKAMMSKINFPKEGLLIASFYKLAFNSAIKLVLVCIVFLVMGIYPDWRIVFVPLILIVLMFFGFVVGLFLTPIGLLYGDIGRSIPIVLQFLMFVSPVVYLIPEEGILHTLVNLNPVTPMIMSARNYMSGMEFYNAGYFFLVVGITMLLSIFAWILYRLSIPIIVER